MGSRGPLLSLAAYPGTGLDFGGPRSASLSVVVVFLFELDGTLATAFIADVWTCRGAGARRSIGPLLHQAHGSCQMSLGWTSVSRASKVRRPSCPGQAKMSHRWRSKLGRTVHGRGSRVWGLLERGTHARRERKTRVLALKVVDQIAQRLWGGHMRVLLRILEQNLHLRHGFGHLQKAHYGRGYAVISNHRFGYNDSGLLLLLSPLVHILRNLRTLLLVDFCGLQLAPRDILIVTIDDKVEHLNLIVRIKLSPESAVREKLPER
ncbi:hypothetical protein C8Q69DRAFT_159021 [Paecilomyces variotii]|uniref:Uncharacterized protein n=1 Tax=Byssochlamys spectabilis TaxID=264951 RepID=A0A443I207_BYSSP|nr:hypothetical protein C8Q69DRAFT_159021 [Paecilomyces variotii]RWQ98077.1 hypothetical protein C8Q69DRAFT_159021 [Paecilomyces variotii]